MWVNDHAHKNIPRRTRFHPIRYLYPDNQSHTRTNIWHAIISRYYARFSPRLVVVLFSSVINLFVMDVYIVLMIVSLIFLSFYLHLRPPATIQLLVVPVKMLNNLFISNAAKC